MPVMWQVPGTRTLNGPLWPLLALAEVTPPPQKKTPVQVMRLRNQNAATLKLAYLPGAHLGLLTVAGTFPPLR